MKKIFFIVEATLLCCLSITPAHAEQESLSLMCSVSTEWCNMLKTAFSKATGISVNLAHKSSAAALAQVTGERSSPTIDIWFGGTGDPHLQAAEADLTVSYQSPNTNQLQDWAIAQATQSGYKTIGVYSGPIGIGYNPNLLAKKNLPIPACWSDLIKPQYKGEMQMSNPGTSGTAYVVIATLVQMHGEEKAFEYLKALHKNIAAYTTAGADPIKHAAHAEIAIGLGFSHDIAAEAIQGLPIKGVTPCEGTGYEIGSMSIIKGARNLSNAKKFYDWALTASAQEIAASVNNFQLPSNKDAKIDKNVPNIKKIKLINYDFAKYGKADTRKHLIERWRKEVSSLPH